MKHKLIKTFTCSVLACMLLSNTAFAAGLTQDPAGIHYQKDDGTVVTSTWVEINQTWYFFDEFGNCTTPLGVLPENKPDDGNYKIFTSYVPYSTSSLETLCNDIIAGKVVMINGQYYMTPEAATIAFNENVVFEYDTNPVEIIDRTAYRDLTF